jgi:hypothetical protein
MEEDKRFYNCVLNLMLEDYKKKGMTLEDAYHLYERFNIATIYKNGKVEFINE